MPVSVRPIKIATLKKPIIHFALITPYVCVHSAFN